MEKISLLHHWFYFTILGFKDSIDDKSRTNLVQIKGRFSVTSENVDLVKVQLHSYSTLLILITVANLYNYTRIFHYVQVLDEILR